MIVLTLESTCDETAAAVVTDELKVLGSVVASQEQLHEKFHGVVPEIAARAHLDRIIPVIDEALRRANLDLNAVDAIAVATTPGLAGSLLVGLTAAKTLALATGTPLVGIDHLQAHVYACQIASGENVFPCIGMIVSGGHSNLYRCSDPFEFRYLGGTIDDAAGEAFDKVATMLGLGYPGGPALSQLASNGDPKAFRFPRPFLKDQSRLDFSFSGLKTAVRYAISNPACGPFDNQHLDEKSKADLAASFEAAIVDCLVAKALLACRRASMNQLCVGGGVAANRRFREQLSGQCRENGIKLWIAPPELCTDNAIMGAIACERLKAGDVNDLTLDIIPGLVRGGN